MSKFYIGQKIVSIKDHSQGIFKKGDEFVVLGITKECCINYLNIGFKSDIESTCRRCECGKRFEKKDRIWWMNDKSFAPIELSNTTFEDVIKQLEPCLN